MPSGLLPGY
jgi:hypothetical protein